MNGDKEIRIAIDRLAADPKLSVREALHKLRQIRKQAHMWIKVLEEEPNRSKSLGR